MNPPDQALSGFINACADLHASFLPWTLPLLVISFATEFWHRPPTPYGLLKFLVKLFLVILLVTEAHSLINDGQALVQQWVEHNVPTLPGNVAVRFQEKLAQAQNDPTLKDQSFLRTLFSSHWFEAIIFAVLTLVAWLAMGVQYLVYYAQRVVLMLCWTLSPLLFPLLAIRPVSHIGLKHVLRTIGIILWPIGLALASTCTDGLLDVATNQTFLGPTAAGSLGRGLITLLCLGLISGWIIVSTVVVPAYTQRIFTGSSGAADVMMHGAEMLANTSLQTMGAAPATIQRIVQRGQSAWESATRFLHRSTSSNPEATAMELVHQRLAPTSETPPPTWQPSPGDPTGDAQARAIVERTKKL